MKEILEAMRACLTEGDAEQAHSAADELLIDALRLLSEGTPQQETVAQLIAIYESVEKWYA